jgi:hypothetical protein
LVTVKLSISQLPLDLLRWSFAGAAQSLIGRKSQECGSQIRAITAHQPTAVS